MARERKGYLLLAAFNPTLLVRGGVEKRGETTRKRAKEGTNEAQEEAEWRLVWMLCLFFPLARYRPEHSRPIPEGKAKVAVTTTGEEKISKPRLVSPRDPLRPERQPGQFSRFPSFSLEHPPLFLRLELMRGFDRARSNGTIREFFCSEAVVGTSRG